MADDIAGRSICRKKTKRKRFISQLTQISVLLELSVSVYRENEFADRQPQMCWGKIVHISTPQANEWLNTWWMPLIVTFSRHCWEKCLCCLCQSVGYCFLTDNSCLSMFACHCDTLPCGRATTCRWHEARQRLRSVWRTAYLIASKWLISIHGIDISIPSCLAGYSEKSKY